MMRTGTERGPFNGGACRGHPIDQVRACSEVMSSLEAAPRHQTPDPGYTRFSRALTDLG